MQSANLGIGLLLDRRQQQRMELRILLLNLPSDLAILRLAFSPRSPNSERPTGCPEVEQGKDPTCPPAGEPMKQHQTETQHGHSRPATRQPAPQLPAPIVARDWFQVFFEEAVDHSADQT